MRRANPTIMYHAVLRCASKSIEYLCKQGYAYPENIYEIALPIGDLETIRAIHDGGCRVIVSDKFFDTNMIAPELLEYADLQLHAVNQERAMAYLVYFAISHVCTIRFQRIFARPPSIIRHQ